MSTSWRSPGRSCARVGVLGEARVNSRVCCETAHRAPPAASVLDRLPNVQPDGAPRQRGRRRRPSAARQGGGHPGSACRSRRRASKRQRPAAACRRACTLWRPVDAAVGKRRASTRAPRDAVLWRRPAGRRERARARTCAPRAGGTRARPAAWARQVHGEARPPAGGPIVSLGGCPATGLGTSCTARQQQRPQPRRPEPLAE
jgi:hypothetical protein